MHGESATSINYRWSWYAQPDILLSRYLPERIGVSRPTQPGFAPYRRHDAIQDANDRYVARWVCAIAGLIGLTVSCLALWWLG